MGLRLSEGIDPDPIERRLGRPLSLARIKALQVQGLIDDTSNRLRVTARGRLVLNEIIKQLAV
jgi:coproporphyrinogen III oxidase-like Fe-S oxidoreductase